ncbi:hypothetical protein AYO20_04458 [Fonsecaea nubica]|uniref:PNPLA domain-containing protein n=1 Tax=Fonsecaea nubica TaxID=856822 RepID=A0A178D298_9EURO|nr:hypothetical protein AYO20_04458 [Fonsecaea nubica]OAL36300.1 hypothetical protein AYO20_04458 [Fonsecaea nubica]
MEESIKKFRDAAEEFMRQIRADESVSGERWDDVLSMVTNIRIGIKELEEKLIPIGLVHGRTYQGLKNRIDYMTKTLNHGPRYEDLSFDLSSSHAKFINDIELVKAHYSDKRKALFTGGRLLSIDGGGVRGVCSLLVLQGLMKAIQAVEKNEHLNLEQNWDTDEESNRDLPLPKHYFDLVGGTSTGGLIAIMLFRLGMPIPTVMAKYDELSKRIFKPGISRGLGTFFKPLFNRPWFSGSELEKEVKKVLVDQNLREDAMMQEDGVRCRTFVCAVTKRTRHTVNFRSYHPQELRMPYHIPCSIVEAARATTAAPFYFPAKKIDGITFWDGGLQNNNTIGQVLGEYGPGIPAVVISLGTGISSTGLGQERPQEKSDAPNYTEIKDLESPSFSWPALSQIRAVLEFVTNAENEHRSFEQFLSSLEIPYFRLNPTMKEVVGLSDYTRLDYLKEKTKNYLEQRNVQNDLEKIARLLLRPLPVDPLGLDDEMHPQTVHLPVVRSSGEASRAASGIDRVL